MLVARKRGRPPKSSQVAVAPPAESRRSRSQDTLVSLGKTTTTQSNSSSSQIIEGTRRRGKISAVPEAAQDRLKSDFVSGNEPKRQRGHTPNSLYTELATSAALPPGKRAKKTIDAEHEAHLVVSKSSKHVRPTSASSSRKLVASAKTSEKHPGQSKPQQDRKKKSGSATATESKRYISTCVYMLF